MFDSIEMKLFFGHTFDLTSLFSPNLTENRICHYYYTTEFYSPEHEGGIRYNDPKVNVEWPLEVTDISEKDKNQNLLSDNFKGIKV